jgi:hypothetical protein
MNTTNHVVLNPSLARRSGRLPRRVLRAVAGLGLAGALALRALPPAAPTSQPAPAAGRVPDYDPPPPPQKLAKGQPKVPPDRQEVPRPPRLAPQPWFTDEHGRHFIPNGVVLNTEDHQGDYAYPDEAFSLLRRYGLNLQVVRLSITRLGGYPGSTLKPEYLAKLDRMVRLGADNGVRTIFKLTLYDLTGEVYKDLTEEHWAALFLNRDRAQDRYLDAWEGMFRRYAPDPNVWGYDLLNEPLAAGGGSRAYLWDKYPEFGGKENFERRFFWPLYERVIDRLHGISPDKWALVQSWHHIVADHRRLGLPSAPPLGPLARPRTVFAPHYYGDQPATALDTYLQQAVTLGLPILIGEYGPPTFPATDTALEAQSIYTLNFMRTVNLFDRHVVGTLKAWWCGSRSFEQKSTNRTWAMFTGSDPSMGPERKYVVDVMCRPRPLAVAGRVESFAYDFATRRFRMEFTPGRATSSSELYLPLARHYTEDGLRVKYEGLVLALPPRGTHFEVRENPPRLDAGAFSFDPEWQRLRVRAWPGGADRTVLEVIPGTRH